MGSAAELYYASYLDTAQKKQDYLGGLFEKVSSGEITMNQAYKKSRFDGTFAEFTDLATASGYTAPKEDIKEVVEVIQTKKNYSALKITLLIGGGYLLFKALKK